MIRVQNLTKYYGERLAVDDISFNVAKGEIVGLLGPNAAGKTTTMRMLTGYMMPTRGDVWIADCNMATQSLDGRRHIGYMPESVPLYTDITVRSYLEFFGKLRGLDKNRVNSRIDEVVELCHLEEYIDVIIGKLSRGFRQRVGIAQAIIHEPEVLILDEPTIGIDPIQVAMTRNLIKELGQEHTILISTHILPEVSMICEKVIIIHQGKIVAEDNIDNLSNIIKGAKRLRIEVKGPAAKVTESISKIKGVKNVEVENSHHIIECEPEQDPREAIMAIIIKNNWSLLAMESMEMSLEDIFLELTTSEE